MNVLDSEASSAERPGAVCGQDNKGEKVDSAFSLVGRVPLPPTEINAWLPF